MKYGSYIAMLLPFLLGLSFIKIYHAEYQNGTLKELLQIPVSLSRLFYAKILFLAAVIIMLANCMLVISKCGMLYLFVGDRKESYCNRPYQALLQR